MNLNEFKKEKDFLICVDSDGCAIDTMDIKHIRCFGPCMITEWHLEKWQDEILARWNEVNLYTMTRGINRFQGLLSALETVDEKYQTVQGLEELREWVTGTKELSNQALEKAIAATQSQILRKALHWSVMVNNNIKLIPQEEKLAFDGVAFGLAHAHRFADIAIVSSANSQAVLDEWDVQGLLRHVDIVLAQDTGTKLYCLQELKKKGYEKDHILMVGDAPGDLAAAQQAETLFFPILVKKEKESWAIFRSEAVEHFINESYAGAYAENNRKKFLENLSGGKE